LPGRDVEVPVRWPALLVGDIGLLATSDVLFGSKWYEYVLLFSPRTRPTPVCSTGSNEYCETARPQPSSRALTITGQRRSGPVQVWAPARSYATLINSTDNTDDVASYLGVAKAV